MLIYVILLVIIFAYPYIFCNIISGNITVYHYIIYIYIYTTYRQLVRKLGVRYYAVSRQLLTTEILDQLVL